MGKPSKLREKHQAEDQARLAETRFSYSDGTRKLYDRDKPPDGIDDEIWHLTLLFEQEGEKNFYSIPGRPVAYTELRNRIEQSRIRTQADWIKIVETMIRLYWDTETDTSHALNDFCSVDKFSFYLQWVLDDMERQRLVLTGNRIQQADREKKPPRQSEDTGQIRAILTRTQTEQELADKMRQFRNR